MWKHIKAALSLIQQAKAVKCFKFSAADNVSTQRATSGSHEDLDNENAEELKLHNSRNGSVIKAFNFRDDRLMHNNWTQSNCISFEIIVFLRVMALCHTGIPVEDERG